MMGTNIMLSEPERWMIEAVASHRCDRVERRHLGAGHGDDTRSPDKVREDHLRGAAGECAFAKLVGVYWDPGLNDFGRHGDVRGWEVRGSWNADANLSVYGRDPNARKVVLVTVAWYHAGPLTAATVRGWVYAGDAKTPENRERYLRQYPDSKLVCYHVPQAALRPFDGL